MDRQKLREGLNTISETMDEVGSWIKQNKLKAVILFILAGSISQNLKSILKASSHANKY